MKYLGFIKENPRMALFAPLALATSGFGQTFFISVFGAGIRGEFGLSNSSYGLYYGLATLSSALLLLKLGGLADRWDLWRITLLALLLLISGCLILGLAPHRFILIPGFLLIRLGGQALLSHLGMSVAGRYFLHQRGRIMALTAAGFPLAAATLPSLAGFILACAGWRLPWLLAAGAILMLALPVLMSLAHHAEHPARLNERQGRSGPASLTREQVLSDPGFYLVLPACLVTPFAVTALLFHQAMIAEIQHWPLEVVGLSFSGFALGHLVSLFIAGPLIDRLGAQCSLPLTLAPFFCGLLVLGLTDAFWTPYLYLALTGITLGGVSAAGGALWPERYGVRHIGAIRSMSQVATVFSTAIAPFILGALLDAGLSPGTLGYLLAALVAFSAGLVTLVRPAQLSDSNNSL